MIQTTGTFDLLDRETCLARAKVANDVGHWRALLALFGTHHPACNATIKPLWSCNCGFWESCYGWPEDKAAEGGGELVTNSPKKDDSPGQAVQGSGNG